MVATVVAPSTTEVVVAWEDEVDVEVVWVAVATEFVAAVVSATVLEVLEVVDAATVELGLGPGVESAAFELMVELETEDVLLSSTSG